MTNSPNCACATIEYELSFSPERETSDLIELESETSKTVIFRETNDLDDAGAYTITIKARFASYLPWTSASATYTYLNPCETATIITN